MRRMYSTDLSDNEWARLRSCLPALPKMVRSLPALPKMVRTRVHSLREIFNAIFYVLRAGCPWRLLPHDFPPWQTVFYHFRRFRLSGLWHLIFKTLRTAERKRVGRNPAASAAIVNSQSIKTVEESVRASGYDAGKNVKGRKQHLLVDTLGLPLSVYVTPANVQDQAGTRCLLAGLKPLASRLKKVWADGAYGGKELANWCQERGGWELEVVDRDREADGFEVLPKRWIVERTFGWLGKSRRLSKDYYERKVQTSEALTEVAIIRLILRRLANGAQSYFV